MKVRPCLGILLLLLFLSCEDEPPAPLPIADFYAGNASCLSPCYVHFYDQSYSVQSWHWDFGNGITSTYQNDSSQYDSPGVYSVTLTVYNADNMEDQITKNINVY